MDEVHVKPIGPAHGMDLPPADPAPALAELERRRNLVADPGADTKLPDGALLAKRAAFERDNGGFWVCNFANERLSTKCDRPNVRLLAYVPSQEEGVAKVAEFMRDVRVKSIPCLVPANTPFLIPFSEAAAGNAEHTLAKIQRLSARHIEFCKYRDDDFKRSVEGKTPGETGLSDYHRRKTYLARQEQLRQRDHERKAGEARTEPHAAPSGVSNPSLFREASASTSFGYDSVMSRIAEGKQSTGAAGGFGSGGGGKSRPTFGSGIESGVAGDLLTASEAFSKVCGSQPLLATAAGGAFKTVTDTDTNTTVCTPSPPPHTANTLWQGELPEHWKQNPDASSSAPLPSAGDWPRELESRRGRHACISFIDDMDKPEDSAGYADAAGMEPLMIIFGGQYENVEDGKAVAKNDVGPWCTDLAIDIVDMYEWLWPTEIDPDKMNEEHRTSNAGYTKEANMIETQRKKTLALTAEARAHAAAASIPLRETNANAEVPDVDAAVASLTSGMFLQGDVVQIDKDGGVIGAATLSYPEIPEL